MKVVIALFAVMCASPAWAQDAPHFVQGWLDRCYVQADILHADAKDILGTPYDLQTQAEKRIINRVLLAPHHCAVGPLTICAHAVDEDACLTAAAQAFEARFASLMQAMPRDLHGGGKRFTNYRAFLNSGGTDVPGFEAECRPDETVLTRLGPALVSPAQCEPYRAGLRVVEALRWIRWAREQAEQR